jgi:hypothetical protein
MPRAVDGMKECSKCSIVKPVSDYAQNNRTGDKLQERCRQCIAQYYKDNKDKFAVRYAQYHRDNREKISTRNAKKHVDNRASIAARNAQYHKDNPERSRAKSSRRRQRIHLTITKEDRELSVEYRKAIKNDSCYYCGQVTDSMHDDHWMPLAKGGTDHWWNLVRSCATCNLSKSAKCGTHFINNEVCDCSIEG